MRTILTLIIAIMATACANAEKIVDIYTSLGLIKVKLYDDTPIHRDNFLKLADEGYYNGTLFHRVIKDFMVQGGDPDSKNADSQTMLGGGDPSYTLEAEILYPTHYHKYGALAAARTGDQVNPERRSSGSQFYIVTGEKQDSIKLERLQQRAVNEQKQAYFNDLVKQHKDELMEMRKNQDRAGMDSLRNILAEQTEEAIGNPRIPENIRKDYMEIGGTPHLDGAYTVFGEVIEGMDVVEKIQNVETGAADRPKEDVRVLRMKVEN